MAWWDDIRDNAVKVTAYASHKGSWIRLGLFLLGIALAVWGVAIILRPVSSKALGYVRSIEGRITGAAAAVATKGKVK